MQDSAIEPIYQKAVFWISAAFILNFSGNFFLFLYSKNSFDDDAFRRHYNIIYGTVTFVKNILLCISILIKENNQNSKNYPFDSSFDVFQPITKQN